MIPSHKESKVIAFEIEGSNLTGKEIVQTIYTYDLYINLLVNKPSFMINSTSQILFPSNDRIMFGCFAAFLFEDKKIVPSAEELLEFVNEGINMINKELSDKLNQETNLSGIKIESIDEKKELPPLKKLVLSGYRLN
jgi:hypothetical protein